MTSNEEHINEVEELPRDSILLEVGELLKNERQTKGLSIESAANALNLRKVYLQALESGDWSAMPGEVYALGFLRQYSAYLHLDLDDSIEKLKSGHYQLTKPLTFPDPPVAPKKSWMIIAALAFIVLFVALNTADQPPVSLPSQLMQNTAAHMQHPPIKKNTNNSESLSKQVKLELPQPASNNNSANPHKDSLKTALKSNKNIDSTLTKKTAVISYNYTFTAVNADVWLQLHDSNEPPTLIREVLLKKGQRMKVVYSEPLRLTCGNALSLQVSLNNQLIVQVNQLGEKGKVLRNYLLKKSTTSLAK